MRTFGKSVALFLILLCTGSGCTNHNNDGSCENVDCSGHGECTLVEGGQPTCICDTGYQSEGLACVPEDCTTPTTCAAQGANCGTIDDGCGGSLDCGTCTSPETCGGGGTDNVCGCVADCTGRVCGSDGCHGSCGNCTEGSCNPQGQCTNLVLIYPNRESGPAPLSVFFEAVDGIFSNVDDFKGPVYHWTFGDPGSGTYLVNGKSKNEASGKVAAHVFTQAGEYTVTLTASHDGITKQESVVISVSDPDIHYAGTSTVCVSASGNFTDCPAGAEQVTTNDFDLDDGGVLSYLSEGTRVLLRSGEAFFADQSSAVCGAGPRHLGAFGSGARPRVVSTVGSSSFWFLGCSGGGADDLRIVGIEIDGVGQGYRGPRTQVANNLLYHDVEVHHFVSQNINSDFWLAHSANQLLSDGFTLSDSNLHDAEQNHNLYVAARSMAILGSTLDGCGSHSLRIGFTDRAVITNNYIANPGRVRSGLAIKMGNETGSENGVCVPPDEATRRFIISDNVFAGNREDWLSSFGPQGTSRAYPETVRDGIIERNVYIAGANTSAMVNLGATDLLFRNNLFIGANSGFRAFIVQHFSCGSPPVTDNQILNNTFYHATGSAVFVQTERGSQNSGVDNPGECYVPGERDPLSLRYPRNTTVRNNLTYSPTGSVVVFNAVDDEGSGANATNTVEQNINASSNPFQSATPSTNHPVKPADYELNGSSAAIDSGMSLPWVHLDFYSLQRDDGSPDVGCMEYR